MKNKNERLGNEREMCDMQYVRQGPIYSHVRALSLRRNHNARYALHKNVICTQITAFACGLFSLVLFLAMPAALSSFPLLFSSLVKSTITSQSSAIKSPLRRPQILGVDVFADYSYRSHHLLLLAFELQRIHLQKIYLTKTRSH